MQKGLALKQSGFRVKGHFDIMCLDKHGNKKWEESVDNMVVDQGLNHILDSALSGASQITSWYVGLISDAGTPAVAATDTLAELKPGNATGSNDWTELVHTTAYTADGTTAGRPKWTEGGVSAKTISNTGNAASFAIIATNTAWGAFICSAATGVSGTLLCAVDFTAERAVASGDTINVTYTLTAADA